MIDPEPTAGAEDTVSLTLRRARPAAFAPREAVAAAEQAVDAASPEVAPGEQTSWDGVIWRAAMAFSPFALFCRTSTRQRD